MKKITMLLAGLMLYIVGMPVQADDPVHFIPKDAVLLVYFDAARLTDMPWLKDIGSAHPDTSDRVKTFEALCTQFKIKQNDFFSGAVYVAARDENQIGIYAQTNVAENVLLPFVSAMMKQGDKSVTVSETTIAGHKAFVFNDTTKNGNQSFALAYLANNVVIVFQVNDANAELLKASTGGCALLSKIDRKQLAAVICEPIKMVASDDAAAKPDVTLIDARLDLTGEKQSDLALVADIDFTTKEKTQAFGMQTQMVAPMMLGMIFGKDQQLAGNIIQGLQITMPTDTRLAIRLTLPEATLKAIGEYVKNPANMPNFEQPGVGGAQEGTGTAAPAASSSAAPASRP